MPYVAHDAHPGLLIPCDGIDSIDWNGWAVPYWRTAEGVIATVEAMRADDPDCAATLAVSLGDGGIIPCVHITSTDRWDDPDVITADADGAWRMHGWTFADVLAPALECAECGASEGCYCRPECPSDEATRY